LQVAINLADSYEKAFEHTRRQLMTQPKGKQFDFNKERIFEKFNIFKRRLEKLVDMFKTIHQFSSLEQHTHIEGLSDMIATFNTITDNVRVKVRWLFCGSFPCMCACSCVNAFDATCTKSKQMARR
jgi:dynein heavy chain, axonemal